MSPTPTSTEAPRKRGRPKKDETPAPETAATPDFDDDEDAPTGAIPDFDEDEEGFSEKDVQQVSDEALIAKENLLDSDKPAKEFLATLVDGQNKIISTVAAIMDLQSVNDATYKSVAGKLEQQHAVLQSFDERLALLPEIQGFLKSILVLLVEPPVVVPSNGTSSTSVPVKLEPKTEPVAESGDPKEIGAEPDALRPFVKDDLEILKTWFAKTDVTETYDLTDLATQMAQRLELKRKIKATPAQVAKWLSKFPDAKTNKPIETLTDLQNSTIRRIAAAK